MRQALCALLAAGLVCPALLAAQGREQKESSSVLDAKDPVQSRRIMLGVAPPAHTLAAPLLMPAQVQPPPGTSAGAAALGSLVATLFIRGIEGDKERAAAEFAAGLGHALSGIDLPRELADQLRKQLERAGYLKGAVLEEVSDAADLEQPGLLLRILERDIFTLDARCVFDRNMTSLHLFTSVRLWRKDGFKPVYAARLHYVSKSFADEQEARRRWIADEGRLLRRSLQEGIAETARMFVADTALRAAGGSLPAGTVQASWIAPDTGKAAPSAIYMLEAGEERILGRRASPEETISIPRESAAMF